MAEKHPYVVSIKGLHDTITQLRASFPATVTTDTLRRLGFAPASEQKVINVLKFLGVIDNNGSGTEVAKKAFRQHDDALFQEGFRELVQSSYPALFELHGDTTWQLPRDRLVQFFRNIDETNANVGQRQARTFSLLRELSGYGGLKADRSSAANARRIKASATRKPEQAAAPGTTPAVTAVTPQVGLTVRIELNLPADASRETYDHIFKSIRKNFPSS